MPAAGSFTAIALFVAALYAAQNLLRYLKAGDWNGVVGIGIAAATGIGVVALGAHADVTAGMHLITNGPALGNLDGGSQVLLGLSVGSAGTVLTDLRKAFDNNSAADKPPIVGPTPPPA